MRLLLVLLVALAAVSGSQAQIPTAARDKLLDEATRILDTNCNATIGAFATALNQSSSSLCPFNSFAKSLANSTNSSSCLNGVGSADNITILLAAGSTCNLTAGCINSNAIVINQVLQLVTCLLGGDLGSTISGVLSNVVGSLQSLPVTTGLALLILQILLTKVVELLCSPRFTLFSTAAVVPASVGIILIGLNAGLLANQTLFLVGLLLLVLLPVVMTLVFVVALLLMALSPILDPILVFVRLLLIGLLNSNFATPMCDSLVPELPSRSSVLQALKVLLGILPTLPQLASQTAQAILKTLPSILQQLVPSLFSALSTVLPSTLG